MPFDVFISYSSIDKSAADAACARLEASSVRCWIAPRDLLPGEEWGGSIIKAIDNCRVMVLIFSSHANASRQVRREVERAVNRGVAIIPLRIEDVEPSESLAYFVSSVHWLDALTPPLAQHLERLVQAARALLSNLPGSGEPSAPNSKQGLLGHSGANHLATRPVRIALRSFAGPKRSRWWRNLMLIQAIVSIAMMTLISVVLLYMLIVHRSSEAGIGVLICVPAIGFLVLIGRKLWQDPATATSRSMREATMIVTGERDQVMDACVAALKRMKAVILSIDGEAGHIEGRLGKGWLTYRQHLVVQVSEAQPGECRVHVRSDSEVAATVFDWGRNSKNINRFVYELTG